MEALKKAEQSKQQTSTPDEVPNNTPTEEITPEKPAESQSNDTVLLEQQLEQVESIEIPNINETVEIEDPNSIFNNLEELDWHFDNEDAIELPIIEQTESIDVSDMPLELASVEQTPEISQTPLLEQAERASEEIADLTEAQLNTEPEEIQKFNVVQTENIAALDHDSLKWDAAIFAPDRPESIHQYAPKPEENLSPTLDTESANLGQLEFNLNEPQTTQPLAKPELNPEIIRPDPLTAKRVLLATAPSPYHRNYKRSALFTVLLLTLLLGLGFSAYYFYQLNSDGPFIQLADFNPKQIWQNPVPKPTILPESTEPPVTQTVIEANLSEEIEPKHQTFMEKAKSLLSEVISEVPIASGLSTPIQYKPVIAEGIEIIEPVQRTTTVTQVQQPLITKSIIDSLDEEQPRPLPQQQGSKDIKIKKVSRNTQHLHNQLNQAYQAFQAGKNQKAKRLYQQVLNTNDKNRDALLGLAAIAQRNQQTQAAEYYYQQILKYYPNDSLAQLGLSSVQQQSPRSSESQIKILLDQSPQSAYLHFSLGNVYAQQERWREAQQAYFDAYRFDEKKADYAYNLAVSLEYLHQSKAAVPFYQKALQLSQGQAIQFNPAQVEKRIQQLTP